MGNFMPFAQYVPETRFELPHQGLVHAGRARAGIAWGDSTIFSNFCLYQPGKAQVLLNLVEWLNYQGGRDLWWLWTLLGLGAIGNGLWLVRRDVGVAGAGGGRVLRMDCRFDGRGGADGPAAPLPSPLPERKSPPAAGGLPGRMSSAPIGSTKHAWALTACAPPLSTGPRHQPHAATGIPDRVH